MKWVVLLLALAVILPTVCLLWFMNLAVRNERLAVQQRLTKVYTRRFEKMNRQLDELWETRIRRIAGETARGQTPAELFERLTRRDLDWGFGTALLIFDARGQTLYPHLESRDTPDEPPDAIAAVRRVEFAERQHDRAATLYEQLAENHPDDSVRAHARLGQIRCLRKIGALARAVTLCRELAYGPVTEHTDVSTRSLLAKAKYLLITLQRQWQGQVSQTDLRALMDAVMQYRPAASGVVTVSSETRSFLLRKTLEEVAASPWAEAWSSDIDRMKQLLATEEVAAALLERFHPDADALQWSQQESLNLMSLLSLALTQGSETGKWEWEWAENMRQEMTTVMEMVQVKSVGPAALERAAPPSWLDGWRAHEVQPLDLDSPRFGPLFSLVHKTDRLSYMLLISSAQLEQDFARTGADLLEDGLVYRITEAGGAAVEELGAADPNTLHPQRPALFKASLGRFFPSWTMEVFAEDQSLFDRAAAEQMALTIWIGVLAIAVTMASGGLAAKVVGSQIRTNRLKNDFIATVTHELKTPLSSMRLLGDTLLEGGAQDREQTLDYLQLMSQENERLSRLIDHFLSFSRMECNKQAFEPRRIPPLRCAQTAATAVGPKFDRDDCAFQLVAPDTLPDLWADEDAIVTVLVNLLDNAHKYSDHPREICLKVSSDAANVRFSVTDNGIGLSRRAQRKIFNRFYQVNQDLTRRVGGCGLGLSITQYIVTAHHGHIAVESQLGQGSTFTVTFPTQTDRSHEA